MSLFWVLSVIFPSLQQITPTNSPKRYSNISVEENIFRKQYSNEFLNQSIESAHFSSSDFTKYVDQNNNNQIYGSQQRNLSPNHPKICETPTKSNNQYQVHVGSSSIINRPHSASPSKKKTRAPETPTMASSYIHRSNTTHSQFRSKPRYIDQPRPSCGVKYMINTNKKCCKHLFCLFSGFHNFIFLISGSSSQPCSTITS